MQRITHIACFIFLLVSATVSSFGQDSITLVRGKVIDADTKLPIEAATISQPAFKEYSISREDGTFSIQIKSPEEDNLTISAIGYQKKNVSAQELLTADHNIMLSKGPLQLNEVIVAAASTQSRNISKVDILLRGINNSQEVLRIVPGLFIGQHAGGGKAEQIFLRGFDIDHGTDINITVDGMPVNMVSHAHGQGYADLHFVIPELIDNVHYDKGPYRADKGNQATAGSVSFFTRNKLPNNFSKVEAGLYNTYRNVNGISLLNPASSNHSLYIASEVLYSRGYFDHPQNFKRLNLFGKYFQNIHDKHTLTVTASTFKSKWNASGQIPERAIANGSIGFFGAIDPREGGITGRSNFNAELKTFTGQQGYIKNQVFFTDYDFELYSNFTFFKTDRVNGDEIRQKEKRSLFGYNGSYHQEQYINSIKWTNEIGASVRMDVIRDIELSRTKNRVQTLEQTRSGDVNEINTSGYLSQTLKWNEHFSLNGALRLDHFHMLYKDHLANDLKTSSDQVILSPKVNFIYRPDHKKEFYVKTGKGFHTNDTRATVVNGSRSLPAAYGTDIGTQWKLGRNLLLDAAVWYLAMKQEFVYVGDEGIVETGGKTRRFGTDLSIRYQPFPFLYVDGNFNYAHARYAGVSKDEQYIPLAPAFTSTGGITVKTNKGWNGGLYYRYMHERPANESNTIIAQGYFITDAHLNYTMKKIEAGISIQNLFNQRWKETQFETESQLRDEQEPVSEIHFTPGTPFFIKAALTYNF